MEQETFDKIHFKHMAMFCHGTILQTQITFKEIPCYMRDSAFRWIVFENAKIL